MPANDLNDASKIKIRRDTAQNWAELNPILDEGEIGIEWVDDTKAVCNIKIGNGIDHFNDLNYFKGSLKDGEISPYISYEEINDQTLPTINGVVLSGDLSLQTLGIQPIGNYASGDVLVQGLALKADKETTYDKDEVNNLISNIRELPDYSKENGTYLKIVNGVPLYSTIDADVVSRETLDEELSKKVDKANGYSLVKETEHQAILDAIETFEGYNIPDIKEDVAFLQTEMDTKAEIGEALPENRFLDKYLLKRDFDGALSGYATLDALRTKANASDLTNHTQNFSNPHNVTLEQLGLSEAYTNYPDPLLLPINANTQVALNDKQDKFEVGYGLTLDNNVLSNSMPNIQTDWLAEEGESEAAILNKPTFSNVAFSGSYNDLNDAPEIEHYILPQAESEVLGGIKLGDDFELDSNGHLKYVSGIVDYNQLANKPSFKDIDGTIYPLIPEMTARDLNLASLTVAKAIDDRLEEEKADKTEIARLDKRIDNIPQIDNVYTKEECDAKFLTEHQDISGKADKSDVYTKEEVYNKTEINSTLISYASKSYVQDVLSIKQDKENMVQNVSNVDELSKAIKYPSVKAILDNNKTLASDYETKIGELRTDVESSINNINTDLEENYYDKTEIDTKLSTVYKYKGTVETMEDLPHGSEIGDVYNVLYERNLETGDLEEWGMNVAWDGGKWDELGPMVDLENYVQYDDIKDLAPKATTLSGYGITDAYTKTETNNLLNDKADKGTTLASYGITDAYTKTDTDTEITNAVSSKASQDDVDALEIIVNNKATINSVYTKSEADSIFATIANVNNKADSSTLSTHIANTNNPHQVTKEQVGLGNVDNTSDLDKPISTATQTALDGKQDVLTQQQLNATNSGIDSSKVEIYDGYAALINEKADYSTVASLSSAVSQNTSNIALKANSSDVYTKAEVDGKVSSSMHFKGTLASVENLPSENQEIGDMYNVLSTGDNYAWDGSKWDKLSETIDLSVYYTKTEISGLLTPINSSISNLESSKQNVLTQGSNITISNNTISAVVPTKVSDLTNDSGYITSSSLPIVNNATLTIQKNGTNIQTFTSNASENVTANITVPTTVAELTDSSNYALESSLSNYALNNSVIHKTDNEEINGEKIFNEGIIAKRDTSGPIVKATSEQGDTYLLVERTITGSNPIQTVIENGLTDTKIGTKSNNSVKIITNDVTQMTLGTDGSVILATDVEANSNNNQVATTKWTTNALSNKANSSEVYTKTEIDAKLENVSADESNLVHKSGDEEITGLKTISLTTTPITSLNIDTNELYNEEHYIATSEIKVNDKVIKTQYSNTFEPEVISGLKFPVQLEKIHNEYSMDTMLAKGDISHFESANETPLSFTKLSFEGVDTTSDTKIFDFNTEMRIVADEYKVDVTDANSNVKSGIQLNLATKHLLLTGDAAKFDINTNKDAVPTIKYVEELVPTKTSQLTNDSGYLTEHQDISGKADKSDTYTKSEIDAKFQYVTQLPENPQEGVTYFILEE